ncbi:hypothetical protein JYU34_001947 [Plutella xylostella]|uniref:Secreted protein n=1 Tax=Plutella xylostella TaxID=51655 RepID=A0ABQ7R565_PLUXY|nr:hypothetical protein JYU34_001947 [Plutella xylostella]
MRSNLTRSDYSYGVSRAAAAAAAAAAGQSCARATRRSTSAALHFIVNFYRESLSNENRQAINPLRYRKPSTVK